MTVYMRPRFDCGLALMDCISYHDDSDCGQTTVAMIVHVALSLAEVIWEETKPGVGVMILFVG
jgi:hypothetical protein